MRGLFGCPGCSRHIRASEITCPFCKTDVAAFLAAARPRTVPTERLGRAALLAFAAVSLGGTACSSAKSADVATTPAPSASAAALTSATTAVAPSAVMPAAEASAAPVNTAPVASATSKPVATGLSAIAALPLPQVSAPAAAYGAPPSFTQTDPLGTVRGNVSPGTVSVNGGAIANAPRVVAGMRAGFRNCYNRELVKDPSLAGRLTVRLQIGPGGEVTQSKVTADKAPGSAVKTCVEARARAAVFDAPEGGSATVTFPVTFVKDTR